MIASTKKKAAAKRAKDKAAEPETVAADLLLEGENFRLVRFGTAMLVERRTKDSMGTQKWDPVPQLIEVGKHPQTGQQVPTPRSQAAYWLMQELAKALEGSDPKPEEPAG